MTGRIDVFEAARRILAARRRRERSLPVDLLGEPAWDVLLDLLVSEADGREVPLKSACIASRVPATTAMRCLDGLRHRGFVEYRADPGDRRRKLLALTPMGNAAIRAAILDSLPLTFGPVEVRASTSEAA